MHTIIHPYTATTARRSFRRTARASHAFRTPHYECADQGEALTISVYVPGVEASGVEVAVEGPDLTISARKARFVRVNWEPLNLESAQRDYLLRLRLGTGFDYEKLSAEIVDGVLTLRLPKTQHGFAVGSPRLRRVA